KAQEAIQQATDIASRHGNPELLPIHILAALVQDKEGIVVPVLGKLGANPATVEADALEALERLSKVSGERPQPPPSTTSQKILDQAFKEADKFKDEYGSAEHLLLAMAQDKRSESGQILSKAGASYDAILKALTSVRGSQRVTDQNPEGKYQALERYAKDLTE